MRIGTTVENADKIKAGFLNEEYFTQERPVCAAGACSSELDLSRPRSRVYRIRFGVPSPVSTRISSLLLRRPLQVRLTEAVLPVNDPEYQLRDIKRDVVQSASRQMAVVAGRGRARVSESTGEGRHLRAAGTCRPGTRHDTGTIPLHQDITYFHPTTIRSDTIYRPRVLRDVRNGLLLVGLQ
ncbi:hypothetical protein J6590_047021 [Homalodisca vitripennis]|nr:hypothetical protein J6590_047021 [Homalodisca vitripennis]